MSALALLLVLAASGPVRTYAPPPIPHALDQGACASCHGPERSGGVPGVPHRAAGYCQSCHVAGPSTKASKGKPSRHARGTRAYPGAPPGVPHEVFMREHCLACHGREVHPGMRRNPHPERPNCVYCHVSEVR
jgi:nitrate reductase (cytochrome), electron transfer subunit